MAQVPARNPKYSAADLWPPGSKDRDFPPAAFFPVYVGNFLCQQRTELVARVQQYFASKGLLARMVFVRSAQNDPFQSYQDKTKLYDCLVYLTREKDAQDAVKYLHRDKYYGHRLNVFPGRVPEPIWADKSVRYNITEAMAHWPDHIIAEHIRQETQAVTHSTKRQDERQLIVQYINRPHQELALKRYRYLLPHSLAGQVIYFQRFVENEVFCEIRHQIAHTPFMVMGPERHVLDALCTGCTPNVPMDWVQSSALQVGSCIVIPNAQFQLNVARLVLTTFGIHCNFVSKLRNNRQNQKAVKKFLKFAATNVKQSRQRYLESLEASPLKVPLPWRAAMGK
ncbi:uncharacterized protein LOC6050839 isoform X5 [Culex quinquefasciatus]|uniref:uncharacterized protein LOC6050839 isoform X5 n=1 Tax=Culex quinquefasciatus TaxID=7176 RepID=UPI0018E29B83|nr:uncharacterized protein LOC6050839 isoform X5 [Culex quinquefasciatus]